LDDIRVGSDNPGMEKPDRHTIHLQRIDRAQNMRRFYILSIQPTLFGEVSLIRNWGRIGAAGQTMVETFDRPLDAKAAFLRIERQKIRRGYRDLVG
jgi:predicted DNA-binding WGR domain protein